jgi:hypothetical protein
LEFRCGNGTNGSVLQQIHLVSLIIFNQTLIRNGGGFLFSNVTKPGSDPGSGGISFATYDTCRTNFVIRRQVTVV